MTTFGNPEWLAQVDEEPIDPDRPIIDPHHHLWRDRGRGTYLLHDLWADTGGGHNVVKTVFLECGASYYTEGPEHLQPVGETQFVAEIAEDSAAGPGAEIAGIVARADLRLDQLDEVLDAHVVAGRGRFRGIRHAGARDPHPEALSIPGSAPEGLYEDPGFRRGVRRLGERGHTYDTWHYHHQNRNFAELAAAVPETTMILDHFGTPLGVGPYAGRHEEIFETWKSDIRSVAERPNVVAKLGGLAMPDNGFGWSERDTPATAAELVEAQERYYLHTIDCFGPQRCMFESNFPVDKLSVPYVSYWNAMKTIAARFTEEEQQAMFHDTAARVYDI